MTTNIRFLPLHECSLVYNPITFTWSSAILLNWKSFTLFIEKNVPKIVSLDGKEHPVNDFSIQKLFQSVIFFIEETKKLSSLSSVPFTEIYDIPSHSCSYQRQIRLVHFPFLMTFGIQKASNSLQVFLSYYPEDSSYMGTLRIQKPELFIGHEVIRSIWKEIIKDDKERLRLSLY